MREDDDLGASSVEYGLAVFAVAGVVAVVVYALGLVSAEQYADSCDVISMEITSQRC